MEKLKLVEFFAGSRSIGKKAEELEMEVFSVDWQPFEGINLVTDIGEMSTEDVPFIPDVVWASPDCTTYSIAACSTHRNNSVEPKTDYAKKSDQVNQHFISLIKQWLEVNPDMVFFIENPRGMMRKMPWMQEFKRHTVWYCTYGDERAKPTDVWTNSKTWTPRPMCHNGNKNCHHQPAPRGARTGTQGRKGSYERSMIPEQLCDEVLMSVLEKTDQRLNKTLFPELENEWEKEWKDMPEFIQEKKSEYSKIIVRFNSEEDLQDFANLIGQKLTNKTKSIWHPFKSHWGATKKIWIDES